VTKRIVASMFFRRASAAKDASDGYLRDRGRDGFDHGWGAEGSTSPDSASGARPLPGQGGVAVLTAGQVRVAGVALGKRLQTLGRKLTLALILPQMAAKVQSQLG
jgi:hypothetical protein